MERIKCDDVFIENLLNEFYTDFLRNYGAKYSELVWRILQETSHKIKRNNNYEIPIATKTSYAEEILYNEVTTIDVGTIICHELWHLLNQSADENKKGISFGYFPESYKEHLIKTGFIKEDYKEYLEIMKARFKNNPDRLRMIKSYEDFEKRYNGVSGEQENEKWTDWFTTQTTSRNLSEEFVNFRDGFYTKRISDKSYYDCYLVLADLVSVLVPREKLLEMFLYQKDLESTTYSFKDLIEELDANYNCVLNEDEKKKYGAFYLGIFLTTYGIDKTIRDDPQKARLNLQNALNICLKAYKVKLYNSKEGMDFEKLTQTFEEIKFIQNQMLWNIDESKMADLEYIKILESIQSQFVEIAKSFETQHSEVTKMINSVDYRTDNSHKKLAGTDAFIDKIVEAENDKESNELIFEEYKTMVGNTGLKGNLYKSLKAVFGKDFYKFLFYKKKTIEDNPVIKCANAIENIKTKEDMLIVYDYIYKLFEDRLSAVPTSENATSNLIKYKRAISELQKWTLFNTKTGRMLPGLERIYVLYNQKINDYSEYINEYIEARIAQNPGIDRKVEEHLAERIKKEISLESFNLLSEKDYSKKADVDH